MTNELEALTEDLDLIYNYVKTCKLCGLKYGSDNEGEQYKDMCPDCAPTNAMVTRIIKRKKEEGI